MSRREAGSRRRWPPSGPNVHVSEVDRPSGPGFLASALTAVAVIGLALLSSAQVVFRSSVDSVSVDVSVRQRGRDVTDLAAADFDVLDNGLTQRIVDISREALPIDVTIVVDLSGSVQGQVLDALTRAIGAVGQRLRPMDRTSIVTFNTRVSEVRALAPGGLPTPVTLGTPVGGTSLFDAVTVSLIAPPEPGRRRMALIFTDGLDTSSFVDGSSLIEVAKRSEMAVFTVALASGTANRRQRPPHEVLFGDLAEATGGAMVVLQRDQDLSVSFVQAFDDFRTSYVLRYAHDGPVQPGWHELAVRVTRRGTYDIRAKQGYFARAPE